MKQALPEEAQERDSERAVILALAGFSFTAVSVVAILESKGRPGLQLALWYVFSSFVAFFAALNLQAYKSFRWENQIAIGLTETGTFCLLVSVLALIYTTDYSPEFKTACSTLGLAAWSIDYFFRLRMEHRYYAASEEKAMKSS